MPVFHGFTVKILLSLKEEFYTPLSFLEVMTMSILNVENLCFGFGDKTVLKNISFRLLKGEHVGLVGINGAGKTTFFNILTGRLVPDDGTVSWSTKHNIGYLDQHLQLQDGMSIRNTLRSAFEALYVIEKRIIQIGDMLADPKVQDSEKLLKEMGRLQDELMISDFYMIDSLIDNVAGGLGLFALGMDTPVDKLSGGQRTKVKLAKLLLNNPDLLLLDEPTNYLDKEHVDWLSEYLMNYRNSFIVISHDIEFLNKITNVIYNIEFCMLKRYPGNYETFLKLKDEERKRYIDQFNKQQEEIAKLEDFINKNLVRASTTKRAQSRQKQLDKIDRLEKPKNNPKPYFTFLEARDPERLVLKSSYLNIGYNYPIIRNLNLKLQRGEKIAITGCNGIGKSTLLKTIMGDIKPLGGKVELGRFLYPLYFEQEVKTEDCTAIEDVWREFPKKAQKEIRDALAKCGLRNELALQKMSTLSGGEQSKVRLCKLLMNPGNFLILDEPTNHLDTSAKEALKDALIRFKGTVLLVCHEKDFYDGWELEYGIWKHMPQ
jgi:ATPase subunit of ABC transporter with duplicated ATPase domains